MSSLITVVAWGTVGAGGKQGEAGICAARRAAALRCCIGRVLRLLRVTAGLSKCASVLRGWEVVFPRGGRDIEI